MTKRTILIILGALLLLLIIALAWWWFLHWSSTQPGPAEGFGSAQDRPGSSAAGGGNTSGTLGGADNGTAGGATGVGYGNVGGIGSSGGRSGSGGNTPRYAIGTTTVSGVTWLPNSGTISNFTPSQVNQLSDGSIGGQISLYGTPPTVTSPSDLGSALAVVGIGTALCTAGLLPGVIAASAAATAAVGAPGVPSADVGARLQNVLTVGNLTNDTIKKNFLDCITRTIARAALQQITASTVNWINSGFNGKPSFVQNYQQFFTNVADQAAGAYIKGSALSFLCSPFGAKIRIALAQSYANRGAASCTLSKVTKNINTFLNGNFNSGGWSGLLQFTTTPTNNPFGAYSYGQIGLANTQGLSVQNNQLLISPGGFLSSQECTGPVDPVTNKKGPPCKTVTPGATIEASLAATLDVDKKLLTQAGVSGSFDAIINALMQQLTLKALQGGLSNLSGLNGYENNFLTPDQQQAQAQGNALLTQLQSISNTAGQYGTVAQGSISDIQHTQEQLQQLVNCYEAKGRASSASPSLAKITELEQKITFYNERITRANAAIALLQGYQSRVLQITSLAQVTAVKTNLNTAAANGSLISATDVTTAQQDRTSLQAELSTTNSSTAAELTLCRAS